MQSKSFAHFAAPFLVFVTLVLVSIGSSNSKTSFAQGATAEAATATMGATMAGTPAPNTLGAPCLTLAEATAAATPAGTAPAEVGAASGIVYKFGLTPWQKGQSEDDVRFLFKPMLEWLGKQVDATFVLVSAKDYQQASDFIANNTVQFVNISPAPFVDAQKKTPGVHMLVTELSCNKATNTLSDSYTGYIMALKTRTDINS